MRLAIGFGPKRAIDLKGAWLSQFGLPHQIDGLHSRNQS
jgi:hypothetical protein